MHSNLKEPHSDFYRVICVLRAFLVACQRIYALNVSPFHVVHHARLLLSMNDECEKKVKCKYEQNTQRTLNLPSISLFRRLAVSGSCAYQVHICIESSFYQFNKYRVLISRTRYGQAISVHWLRHTHIIHAVVNAMRCD